MYSLHYIKEIALKEIIGSSEKNPISSKQTNSTKLKIFIL